MNMHSTLFLRATSLYRQQLSNRLSSNYLRLLSTMSRPKVFVSRNDIPKKALDLLSEKCDLTIWDNASQVPREFILKNVQGASAIFCVITDKIDAEVMDRAGKDLKIIATMSVGFDHVDIAEAKKRGIRVGFTPGVLTDATAELTVAVLLAASRRLFESHQELLSGGWERSNWGPMWMTGPGLANSTVGIFGLGRIGMGVMARLRGFNVGKFLYHDIAPRTDNVDATFVDFDTLLRESDFIVTMCSLTDQTRDIFNERAFSLMKPNAVFVNTSRGGVVKQSALIDALRTKKIFAAGLDVMTPEPLPVNHELLKLPNCVVLPHIASASWESRTEMAILSAKNILAALAGQDLPAGVC